MENDFSFRGFHRIDQSNDVVTITVLRDVDDIRNVTHGGTWGYGDLFVSHDGLYVESTVENAYRVLYTWDAHPAHEVLAQKGLVFVEGEPTRSGRNRWFTRAKLYYPHHTRYVLDVTKPAETTCMFNMKVKLVM